MSQKCPLELDRSTLKGINKLVNELKKVLHCLCGGCLQCYLYDKIHTHKIDTSMGMLTVWETCLRISQFSRSN